MGAKQGRRINRFGCMARKCCFSDPWYEYISFFVLAFRHFKLVNLGSGIAIVRATWNGSFCAIKNITHATKINIVVTTITDWVLLVLMFIGLLRWKKTHQRGGIWWLLYTQVRFFSSHVHVINCDDLVG